MNFFIVDEIITNALNEDITDEDITTNSIFPEDARVRVELLVKEEGIIAGLKVFARVFKILGGVETSFSKYDGDRVEKGEVIGEIWWSARSILSGERVALNLLQRMSGIATLTDLYIKRLGDSKAKLVDTRKTVPGLRYLDKYAVRAGGGVNHRYNLSDSILIKDNHIGAAGSIKNAVKLVRENASFVKKVEIEVEDFDMLEEALEAEVDIIMLDNMSLEDMERAVEIIDGRALTEASGGVNLMTIYDVGKTGVDYISVGRLTHSVKALDISMKGMRAED